MWTTSKERFDYLQGIREEANRKRQQARQAQAVINRRLEAQSGDRHLADLPVKLKKLNPNADFSLQPFLIDECVMPADCAWFRALGYPVMTIQELKLHSMKDPGVFAYAKQNQLGIITYDRGFTDPESHHLHEALAIVAFAAPHMISASIAAQARIVFGSHFRLEPDIPGRVLYFRGDHILEDVRYREHGTPGVCKYINYMQLPQRPLLGKKGQPVADELKP